MHAYGSSNQGQEHNENLVQQVQYVRVLQCLYALVSIYAVGANEIESEASPNRNETKLYHNSFEYRSTYIFQSPTFPTMWSKSRFVYSGLSSGRGWRGYQSGSAGVFGHEPGVVENFRKANEQQGTLQKMVEALL